MAKEARDEYGVKIRCENCMFFEDGDCDGTDGEHDRMLCNTDNCPFSFEATRDALKERIEELTKIMKGQL